MNETENMQLDKTHDPVCDKTVIIFPYEIRELIKRSHNELMTCFSHYLRYLESLYLFHPPSGKKRGFQTVKMDRKIILLRAREDMIPSFYE